MHETAGVCLPLAFYGGSRNAYAGWGLPSKHGHSRKGCGNSRPRGRRDAERQREWEATRKVLDELAPEIVEQCKKRKLTKTRLAGLLPHKAWTFSVSSPHRAGEVVTYALSRD